MKFVLVNGRTPRPQSFCALCCEPIGESYLRELTTQAFHTVVASRAGLGEAPDWLKMKNPGC
jgi:hypothetical protein